MRVTVRQSVDCLQSMSDDCFMADAITVETEDRSVWLANEIIREIRLCHDMMRIVVGIPAPHAVTV